VDGTQLLMYCRPWCGDCRRARAWLAERGIPYVEIDVEENPEARERAARLNAGDLHTPTFELGEQFCVDFRPERLCEMLGIEP
jgi:mycoredoxin